MKTKSPKVYTVPQVGKVLGVGLTTVYDYITAGLVHAERHTIPGKRGRLMVSEAEFERLKRNGVDAKGVTAKLAGRSAGGRQAAKKTPAKRSAVATAAKKRVKRKAVAAVAKKQVKRAAAATRKVTKKQKRK